MEGENAAETGGGSYGAPVSSRWNPTKEQISILENLYKQGVRTPSADQIQQITTRLKVHGHIEGKNVFYWFQNHKARQRQKQKQESLAYFNRFLHINSPPPPAFASQYPCPNGWFPHIHQYLPHGPYYVHQNDFGYYPQYHNSTVLQTGGVVRRRSKSERINSNGGFGYDSGEYYAIPTCENEATAISVCESYKTETLPLFPTHPTGDLQVRPPTSASASVSSGNSAEDSSGFSSSGVGGSLGCGTYFDFFTGKSS